MKSRDRNRLVKKRWFIIVGMGFVGCSHSGGSLRARSAGDTHCPEADLKIYRIDDRSYRVVGCGQESVYIEVCARAGGVKGDCTWHLDAKDTGRPVSVQVVGEPASAGCSYDNQCKGERVCVNHECKAPVSDKAQ